MSVINNGTYTMDIEVAIYGGIHIQLNMVTLGLIHK